MGSVREKSRVEERRAEERRSEKRKSGGCGASWPDERWKIARRCGAKHISKSKKCTPLLGEAHLQVKKLKTLQVRNTFWSWDVEKVHTVVAQSTFASEKAKNTSRSDHFWKLRCRKSARRLQREAHFEIKMFKTSHVRTTFGSSDVVSRATRKGLCTLSKVSKTWWFCTIFNYNNHHKYIQLHYTTLHYITLTTLHYTTLDYISLHYTTLHYTTLYHTTLHYTRLHSTTLHYMTVHYTLPHYTTLQLQLQLQPQQYYIYTTLHYTTLITLHSTTLHRMTLHYTYNRNCNCNCNYTTLHYTTLMTLHYTTLHYTTSHSLPVVPHKAAAEVSKGGCGLLSFSFFLWLSTYLPTYLPTFLPSYLPTYLPTYLPPIYLSISLSLPPSLSLSFI